MCSVSEETLCMNDRNKLYSLYFWRELAVDYLMIKNADIRQLHKLLAILPSLETCPGLEDAVWVLPWLFIFLHYCPLSFDTFTVFDNQARVSADIIVQ